MQKNGLLTVNEGNYIELSMFPILDFLYHSISDTIV